METYCSGKKVQKGGGIEPGFNTVVGIGAGLILEGLHPVGIHIVQ